VVEPVATEPAEASAEATAEPAEAAKAEIAPQPAQEEVVNESEDGGINLPPWLLLLAGLLIGSFGAWAIFGREPGTPTPEK